MYWDVVDIQPKFWGSSFLEKVIALNRFKRFEYEYRKAEYEQEQASTAIPTREKISLDIQDPNASVPRALYNKPHRKMRLSVAPS
jgi:hypothetical protein